MQTVVKVMFTVSLFQMNQKSLLLSPCIVSSFCSEQSHCFPLIQRNCLFKSRYCSFVSDPLGHHQLQQQLYLRGNLLLPSGFASVSRVGLSVVVGNVQKLVVLPAGYVFWLLLCSSVALFLCRCFSVCSKGEKDREEENEMKRRESERTNSLVSSIDRE